jgi:hypothetical protein
MEGDLTRYGFKVGSSSTAAYSLTLSLFFSSFYTLVQETSLYRLCIYLFGAISLLVYAELKLFYACIRLSRFVGILMGICAMF